MSFSTDSTPVGAPESDAVKRRPATGKAAGPELDFNERFPSLPAERWTEGLDWPVFLWLALIHVGVFAAPFTFTWVGLASVFVLHWLTGGVGICLGFHRYLTHNSFETYRPVRWFLALCGGLAGEGSALHWVAIHRKHHAHSDEELDPHSPRFGGIWSHMTWLLPRRSAREVAVLHRKWAPDLFKDPVMRYLDYGFLPINVAFGMALFFAGQAIWGTETGWSLLVYGMFVRLTYVLHSTWFVNSATHIWGYKNYETKDDSRNLWWVAVLTYGEGWHNNHHAHPRTANHGHQWWEFDFTYTTICAMEKVGLAWNIARKRAPGKTMTNAA